MTNLYVFSCVVSKLWNSQLLRPGTKVSSGPIFENTGTQHSKKRQSNGKHLMLTIKLLVWIFRPVNPPYPNTNRVGLLVRKASRLLLVLDYYQNILIQLYENCY